jgi:5-methyltetrahydrofolate--homocysteine methyltransferase
MLDRVIAERWVTARAVVGLFPASRAGDDDIEVYEDEERRRVLVTFHFLRQQEAKLPGHPHECLADFVAPPGAGCRDYLGAFALTAGIGIEKHIARFEQAQDDYSALMLRAIAGRLAEALAERMHERVRKEFWGYAPDERLDREALLREKYRGIRPAIGYPACPDHTEKGLLWDLLGVRERIGMQLTETFAMVPVASVSGLYFSLPQSHYFAVGRIERDQVEDYARRKGMDVAVMERWLAPNLAYDPRRPAVLPPASGGDGQ